MVAYDDLMADWRSTVERVATALDVRWPDGSEAAAGRIDAFIREGLRHHVETGDASRDRVVPAWVRRAWKAVRDPGPDLSRKLARLAALLHEADSLFAPEIAAGEQELAELEAEEEAGRAALAGRDVELVRLREELETAGAQSRELREELEVVAREVAAARASQADRDAEASRLRAEHRDAHIELGRQAAEAQVLAARNAALERELAGARAALDDASSERAVLQAELSRQQHEVASRADRLRGLEDEVAALRESSQRQAQQVRVADEALRRRKDELAQRDTEAAGLEQDLEALRGDLRRRTDALRDRERDLAQQAESNRILAHELSGVRAELAIHHQTLDQLYGSRSWRLTRPLRWAKQLRGGGPLPAPQLDTARLRPGSELLPGEPFRQGFRVSVPELTALGIYFFTYRKLNETRVRVRLLEERAGRLLPGRLLHEEVLEGDRIEDGRMARIQLPAPLWRADRRRLVCEIESLDGRPDETVTVACAPAYYPGRILSEAGQALADHALALVFNPPAGFERHKSFAFVSGCPGDAYRYRCEHAAEILRFAGYTADVYPPDTFPWDWLLHDYQVVVAHRVPHTPDFEKFVAHARRSGVAVVFDTDDLVFDPDGIDQIDAVVHMDEDERALFIDGVKRYRRALALCERVAVSTNALAEAVEDIFPEKSVALLRNRVSEAMRRGADEALLQEPPPDRLVRLAYFSGTRTHRRDFAECVPALARILDEHRHARLVLVGHIDVPAELERFAHRIERHPFMEWRRLPALYREMDVNLAPLESDNRFTAAKSELKYLEAGLLGVPTVASRVGAFEVAIEHGETGFLCASEPEWYASLRSLVEDRGLRERIGRRARRDVLARYATRAAAARQSAAWADLVGHAARHERRLRVAWILRAPIGQTGGGYKKIFQIANHLADHGHEVDVYVEPIAHLEGLTDVEIERYCHEHFGRSAARIRVGHDAIRTSDVAVATNWPTAHVVDGLENTALKAYFVQDWEPDFYEETDGLHQAAEATYDLPLRIVSIGRYLADRLGERNGIAYEHVDFALADEFFADPEAVERKLAEVAADEGAGACSVLFFARPEIPRRCFDLGVAALERLHERCPGVVIRLYGMERERDLPFPYQNLGVLGPAALAAAMRDADVHLSFSETNASTVMFEAMASGCVAVELDQPGVRALLEDTGTAVLVKNLPEAVSEALVGLVSDGAARRDVARRGHASVRGLSVENMCAQFEAHLLRASIGARSMVQAPDEVSDLPRAAR